MCQPKSQGGKRCLRHRAGTKASLSYIHAKTGIDKEQIYAIMKELNKEGRSFEAPSQEELEKYFNLEEFKAKYDNTLDEKEKVAILKSLLEARAEAKEQPVTGGAFHAWKNALARTVERFKKPFIAAGVAGTLIFGLAGCVGGNVPNNTDPTNGPAPTETVACSTVDPGAYGDVVPEEEVTDDYGTYCKTTIDPTSDALKYDPSKVDVASLQQYGFTEKEAEQAQVTAVTFLAEQGLDSSRLDNDKVTDAQWLAENGDLLSAGDSYAGVSLVNGGLLVGDYLPTPIVRDGSPRSSETNIQVNRVYATEATSGKKIIVVETGVTSKYNVSNSAVVDLFVKNTDGATRESVIAENPQLGDEVRPANLLVQGSFTYSVTKEAPNKIAGSRASWTLSTQEGVKIAG
jgi:hypothetical protein